MSAAQIFGRAAVVICGLLAGGCTTADRPAAKRAKPIRLRRCHLSAPGHPTRVEARCGSVEVPEDWSKPSADRRIRLRVAVVAAETNSPRPDPLLFIAGGPGQAATESFPPVAAAFDKILRHRDVILVDQRGTGRSNPLQCDPPEGIDLYLELDEAKQERWLRACIRSLSRGAALKQYTTLSSIQDLDHVRQQLGYERLNLYGISYGTRVALSYLRRYPARTRSVILDGVVPQDLVLGPEIVTEGPRRTKQQLLRRCAADPSCSGHFPRLPAELAAIERRLRSDPPTARVIHPRTGKLTRATLDWPTWSLTLRISGYASSSMSLLPLLIHTAHQRRDLGPLLVHSIYVGDTLRAAINAGLENTVLCSEDWPFYRQRPARDPAASRPAGEPSYGEREIRSLAQICRVWPHRPVPASFKRPVASNAPVLILSGEIDPVTPPANGRRVARTLPASLHLVVPGHGHGVIGLGCVPEVAADFVDRASAAGLDAACLARIKPLPFFIDLAGPEP